MVPITRYNAVFAICQLLIYLMLLSAPSLALSVSGCPINFGFQNYTIITSQCKGPTYPQKVCCGAFKQFACPFAQYLNDLSTNCAGLMFSYINLYGKYPPGLFANLCREGKDGLACGTEVPAPSPSEGADASNTY